MRAGSRRTCVAIGNRGLAYSLARTFIVPEDLGTPPGALSLRGATNFQTPPGWDTVYIGRTGGVGKSLYELQLTAVSARSRMAGTLSLEYERDGRAWGRQP